MAVPPAAWSRQEGAAVGVPEWCLRSGPVLVLRDGLCLFGQLAQVPLHAQVVDRAYLLNRAAPVAHLDEVEARGDRARGRGQADAVRELQIVAGWRYLDQVGVVGGGPYDE